MVCIMGNNTHITMLVIILAPAKPPKPPIPNLPNLSNPHIKPVENYPKPVDNLSKPDKKVLYIGRIGIKRFVLYIGELVTRFGIDTPTPAALSNLNRSQTSKTPALKFGAS